MSLFLLIVLLMLVGFLYLRRKARRMFANFNEQFDPYREMFDKKEQQKPTDDKQVFEGHFEEVRTTKVK